jgi:nucleotidyltransferase/DNA polymerase involved in DNA repair
VVEPDQAADFLEPLPIRVIPGIGPKSAQFLHARNVRTVADLRQVRESSLIEWFGKWGARLFEKARGLDDSEVSNDWIRKSLGEQETFEENTRDRALITDRLSAMAERILAKLKANQFTGFRTVTLTVRLADFQTSNRSRSFKEAMVVDENASSRLQEAALTLLLPFFDERENPRGKPFRLIGLRVEKLF